MQGFGFWNVVNLPKESYETKSNHDEWIQLEKQIGTRSRGSSNKSKYRYLQLRVRVKEINAEITNSEISFGLWHVREVFGTLLFLAYVFWLILETEHLTGGILFSFVTDFLVNKYVFRSFLKFLF